MSILKLHSRTLGQPNERNQMSDIILQDLGLVYPPQSSLPKEQGTFILCRLTQFPSRDEKRNIIDGEYTNCCFTSAFGRQAGLLLPNGKRLSLTVSKWRRNSDGDIARPTNGDQLTYWFDDTQEDELKYCIENNVYYVFGDTSNPDGDFMLPDVYTTHIQRLNSQTMVHPTEEQVPVISNPAQLSGN